MTDTHHPDRLLVTGGAGFIGCNFVQYWLNTHPEARVVVLDALTYAGSLDNLEPVQTCPGLRFVQGDIRDQALVERLLREERIDTVVHFAAESHVDRSISGPDAFIETNVIGTHALLKAVRTVWLDDPAARFDTHRFHHVSTDEVYGSLGPDDPPFTETTPYAPNSPYSASKAASDHLVRAYHHTYGLNTTISNCSNNYGPYHYPEKLIPLAITRLLTGGPVPIYGDGRNVRDWLHVSDHCRGIEAILSRGQSGEVYNIGGNQERTNREIIDMLCRVVDRLFVEDPELAGRYPDSWPARGQSCQAAITFVPDRPGHDRRYAIDAGKIREALGFSP
ncbi:MAG: dTDP-glucose 4,6-dehydratase, partial [Halothiobacillaceae bacterium]